MPLVTVIIPLYNKAHTLERAVHSVRAQTFPDLEILVIDDGSTDGGGELAQRLTQLDDTLQVISQPNAGPGAARNCGLVAARGKLAAFLDADDAWDPQYLARGVAFLAAHPEAASVTSGYFHHPPGHSMESFWRRRGLDAGIFRLLPSTDPKLALFTLAYMSSWSTLARTDELLRLGGFFARNRCLYGEDSFLFLKLLLNAPVGIHFEPLVHYHTEDSALSHGLRWARPIEPMLENVEELEEACPAELRDLLTSILALRAQRTACMLGYWGEWRRGRALLERFNRARGLSPGRALANVCASPLGTTAGATWRWLNGRLRFGST